MNSDFISGTRMRKLAREGENPQMASWPPKHGKSWQIIMRPWRRTTKCPSEPLLLISSFYFCDYFSIAFQWLILFRLYICEYIPHTRVCMCVWYIYSIYSKTEDQTLAGKRKYYHFKMKLLFCCIWAVAPIFLKLWPCVYLPKNKAYFPAEVLPTCTLKRKSHPKWGVAHVKILLCSPHAQIQP